MADESTTQVVTTDTATGEVKAEELDSFGRTVAERTVVLLPVDAEAVNNEVEAGSHETYDGALAYIIQRGIAEIKRTRDAAAKLVAAKPANDNLKQPPPPTVVQKGPLLPERPAQPQRKLEKAEDYIKSVLKVDGAKLQFSFRGLCLCGWQSYQANEADAKAMVVRHAQRHVIQGDILK